MKHAREIKVAVLAIVCIFLVYFGFYFLKGVNIFSPIHSYVGLFTDVAGLTAQAPVTVRGYKVGQVDKIDYDFTRSQAFTVYISMDKDIVLPLGTQMVLASDGLLGGKKIDMIIPSGSDVAAYHHLDTLPTAVELSLIESLQSGVLVHLDSVVSQANDLLLSLNEQMSDRNIQSTLANIHRITTDLTTTSQDLKLLTHSQLPPVIHKADTAIDQVNDVLSDISQADLTHMLTSLDSAVAQVNQVLASSNSTMGLLLNDRALYQHIDSTVVSLDALISDLKANPKRYVNITIFGKRKEQD